MFLAIFFYGRNYCAEKKNIYNQMIYTEGLNIKQKLTVVPPFLQTNKGSNAIKYFA